MNELGMSELGMNELGMNDSDRAYKKRQRKDKSHINLNKWWEKTFFSSF